MRIFLLLLILIFSLQSLTKADNISDFEIEGMSIGNSLLDYMSKSEIKENYIDYGSNLKFYASLFNRSSSQYDRIEIWLKAKDKKFVIYGINAGIYINNLKECIELRDSIVSDIKSLFLNIKFQEGDKIHDAYKDSKQYLSQFQFNDSRDNIRVECIIFGKKTKKKHGFENYLGVIAQSNEIVRWGLDGYN